MLQIILLKQLNVQHYHTNTSNNTACINESTMNGVIKYTAVNSTMSNNMTVEQI